MGVKECLVIELYKLLAKASADSDCYLRIELPCGSELAIKIKAKRKLEIVKDCESRNQTHSKTRTG